MEIEFDDRRPLITEHFLKINDVLVAFFPDIFTAELFHANGDDVLVVAAVEHHDLTIAGNMRMHPP